MVILTDLEQRVVRLMPVDAIDGDGETQECGRPNIITVNNWYFYKIMLIRKKPNNGHDQQHGFVFLFKQSTKKS